MYRAARFAFLLAAGLGLLTWIALLAANETTRRWFEKNVILCADLAISGRRRALVSHWQQRQWRELSARTVSGLSGRSQIRVTVERPYIDLDRMELVDRTRLLLVKVSEGEAR
jgi:hypothetical protein